MNSFVFYSNSPAATSGLGKRLGERLRAGDVLALTGELGCGKTLLTRGICAGLGVPSRQVNSPTFVLVNEYAGRLPVFHLDLYRLEAIDEELGIGLLDYLARAAAGVMVVEWAERMAPLLPPDCLEVRFEVLGARRRRLEFSAGGGKLGELMAEIDGA